MTIEDKRRKSFDKEHRAMVNAHIAKIRKHLASARYGCGGNSDNARQWAAIAKEASALANMAEQAYTTLWKW